MNNLTPKNLGSDVMGGPDEYAQKLARGVNRAVSNLSTGARESLLALLNRQGETDLIDESVSAAELKQQVVNTFGVLQSPERLRTLSESVRAQIREDLVGGLTNPVDVGSDAYRIDAELDKVKTAAGSPQAAETTGNANEGQQQQGEQQAEGGDQAGEGGQQNAQTQPASPTPQTAEQTAGGGEVDKKELLPARVAQKHPMKSAVGMAAAGGLGATAAYGLPSIAAINQAGAAAGGVTTLAGWKAALAPLLPYLGWATAVPAGIYTLGLARAGIERGFGKSTEKTPEFHEVKKTFVYGVKSLWEIPYAAAAKSVSGIGYVLGKTANVAIKKPAEFIGKTLTERKTGTAAGAFVGGAIMTGLTGGAVLPWTVVGGLVGNYLHKRYNASKSMRGGAPAETPAPAA